MITIYKKQSFYYSELGNKIFFNFLNNALHGNEEEAVKSIVVACMLGQGVSDRQIPSDDEILTAMKKAEVIMLNKEFKITENSAFDLENFVGIDGFITLIAFEKQYGNKTTES